MRRPREWLEDNRSALYLQSQAEHLTPTAVEGVVRRVTRAIEDVAAERDIVGVEVSRRLIAQRAFEIHEVDGGERNPQEIAAIRRAAGNHTCLGVLEVRRQRLEPAR